MRVVATVLATLAALVLLAIAFLPWWLPRAAAPIARRYGVTFGSYERIGYGRFALGNLRIERPGLAVAVTRVELDSPLAAAWGHLSGHPGPVVAGDWTVTTTKRNPVPGRAATPSGWVPLRTTLWRIADRLEQWVPHARVGHGHIAWPRGELSLDGAAWDERTLQVKRCVFRGLQAGGTVTFSSGEDDTIHVALTETTNDGAATLDSHAQELKGTVAWWSQPFAVDATFNDTGWLPSRADFFAQGVELPGARLKLANAYTQVRVDAHVHWENGRFHADVAADGKPAQKHSPPLEVTFRADGDPQSVTIAALHGSIPGAVANLSAPVTISRGGRIADTTAEFEVRANLAAQPWFHGRGFVTGSARVVRGPTAAPVVKFSVTASDFAVPGTALRHADVEGELAWPRLTISRAEIAGQQGETLDASGTYDFRAKAFAHTTVHGKIGRPAVARWLPPTVSFTDATVQASADGPVATVASRGQVTIHGVRAAAIRPGDVALTWEGRGLEIPKFEMTLQNADARVVAGGAATTAHVRLTKFQLRQATGAELSLVEPAEVRWRPALTIGTFRLAGPGASLDLSLALGETGSVSIAAHGFSSRWITAMYPLRGPEWSVPSFALTGRWDHGPMIYSAAGAFEFALPDKRNGGVTLSIKGDEHGMTIDALHGVERGNAVVNASGTLPILLSPGRKDILAIAPDGPVGFEATTVPDAAFWQQLGEMSGVDLRAPRIKLHVTGTWSKPQGTVEFRVQHAAMDPKRFTRPMPTIDDVDVALTAEPTNLRLDRFSVAIEGQLVRASGEMAFDRATWPELSRAPLAYLQQHARLRVEVPDAQVAKFSRYLPAALAPAGRLDADIRFDRGTLGGFLHLRDAASRPLGPLGVLQQISADVDFEGHRVLLRRVAATSGGQPLTVSGSVELPTSGWVSGELTEPRYDITVKGKNLPFVRQSGMLIRGDVDLALRTPDQGSPRISGKVVLRDSLFLTDVRAFLPHGGGPSPSRRPPYFAVETPPLNTWVLDVDVLGTRFIRIRMPVFSGLASTHFHLGGTLGDPRAIGEATIDEGTVRMPFASFQVRQGAVRLTEEDPFEPTIFLRGVGQHWGYDLTLEINGKASSPNISFTSSPALDPEQVLLMVMTGAAPANEVNSSLTHRAVQIGAFFGQSLMSSLTGGGDNQDRLSIESGAKISEQGKETYDIEYKLSDRWTLTGEYDEFDQYIAGLKWRVAPKKTPR